MAHRVIQVGTGGFGNHWCRHFLPPNVEDGLVEVVAAVDKSPEALANARDALNVPKDRCFTDCRKAFTEVEADFCTIVVPPAHHEQIVDAALAAGLNILSEKPIADTLEAACRIAEKVRRAGVKMGVTMSHRFRQDITTLRRLVQSGEYGPLDYLVCRFTCENRTKPTWGKFRYEIPDPLLVEGSVHHLDLLVDMTGGACESLYARTWQPPWGEFAGDAQAMVLMDCADGRRAFYEGAKTNAVGLNGWGSEYIRAECRDATFVLQNGRIERFDYDPARKKPQREEGTGTPVPLDEQPKWANAWLIEQYCRWLDGGEPMATHVEANLQSMALIFAAVESSRTGRPVDVQGFLAGARERATAVMG